MSRRSSHISAAPPQGIRVWAAIFLSFPALAQPRPYTADDLWQAREILEPRISPDGAHVAYVVRSAMRDSNRFETRLWVVPANGGGAAHILSTAGANDSTPRWSPDSERIAWLSERDGRTSIVVRAVDGQKEAVIPAQEAKSLAWSADGTQLAYTANLWDPMPGISWAPPALTPQLKTRHTRLFLVAAAGGAPVPIPLGDLEPASEPQFFADGRGILIALSQPFDAEHPLEGPDLYTLRVPDFTPRRLTNRPGADFESVPSPDGSRIAWLARDPVPRVYQSAKLWVANPDGSRARTLAGALDRAPGRPWWSSDSRTVYFVAEDRGVSRVYAARSDGSVRQVLSEPGLRDLSVADNGKAVAVRDTGELIVFAVDLAGAPRILAAPNRDWMTERTPATVQPFEFASGTFTIEAWMTRPPGFDPSKKYPVLLDIDDAPRRMCGAGFRLRSQVFAAAGMIVVCVNARGAPGYGENFGNVLPTAVPGDDIEDYMAALNALAANPYVDASRLRIAGGGSAARAVAQTTRFQSAVVRRPLVDAALEIAQSQDGVARAAEWMGVLPWDDPARYTGRSLLYAKSESRTPVLIFASDHDAGAEELAFVLRTRKVQYVLLHTGDTPGDRVAEWQATLGWLAR